MSKPKSKQNIHDLGMTDNEEEITAQQRLFVEEYLKTFSPSKAAQAAGYEKASGAHWLMKHPGIRTCINRRMNDMMSKHQLEQDAVMRQLMAIAFDNDPKQKQIRPSDQIKALEILAKMNGWMAQPDADKTIQPPNVNIIVTDDPDKINADNFNTITTTLDPKQRH